MGDVDGVLSAQNDPASSLRDAQAQSEAALAEAIQESQAIRRILRTIVIPGEALPGTTDVRSDARGPAEAASAASETGSRTNQGGGRMGLGAPFRAEEITATGDGEGLPLRDALRSIVIRARGQSVAAAPASDILDKGEADGGYDGSGEVFDLRQRLLSSRQLGLAIENIIQISPFDNSFSIFGLGHFEIKLTPDDHAAVVTELSSNTSVSLGSGVPSDQPGQGPGQGRGGEPVSIWGLVWLFLDSSAGMLTAVIAGALSLMWGTFRIATSLRRSEVPRSYR